MKVIPTLLTTTVEEFKQQLALFQKYYSRIQIDVADGILVSNKTTPIDEIVKLLKNDPSLIKNKNVVFDFHMMVENFQPELEKIEQLSDIAQISTILLNASLTPDLEELGKKFNSFKFGLDIFPAVQIETIIKSYDLKKVDSIQVMSVEPGLQGQPFLSDMLYKIEQLRLHYYRHKIFIDGGVNENTIPLIISKEYTPDYLCIGSYLTKAGEHLDSRILHLKTLGL